MAVETPPFTMTVLLSFHDGVVVRLVAEFCANSRDLLFALDQLILFEYDSVLNMTQCTARIASAPGPLLF